MNVLLRDMVPCPHCGVLLESRLVASIRDPHQPESCPARPKPVVHALEPAPVAEVHTPAPVRSILAAMMEAA